MIYKWGFKLSKRIYSGLVRIKTKYWYRLFFGKIGNKSYLYRPLMLNNPHNIFMDDNVWIYKNARIETIEKWGSSTFSPVIKIGKGCAFGQGLHMTAAGELEIGENCTFSANVWISDINHEYAQINKNVIEQPLTVEQTSIGNFCFIGLGACILPGTKIGDNCVIGTNSVVKGIYPDGCVIVGMPAKVVKRYDFKQQIWRRTNSDGEFLNDN